MSSRDSGSELPMLTGQPMQTRTPGLPDDKACPTCNATDREPCTTWDGRPHPHRPETTPA